MACTLLHMSVHKAYVWCMHAPSHMRVWVHVCEYVCALWYVGAIPPFLCPQGLGYRWPENQGGRMETRG